MIPVDFLENPMALRKRTTHAREKNLSPSALSLLFTAFFEL